MSTLDTELPFFLNLTISLTMITILSILITIISIVSFLFSIFNYWKEYRSKELIKYEIKLENGKIIEAQTLDEITKNKDFLEYIKSQKVGSENEK